MRVAVIGHIEWVRFLRLAAFPRPGQILHAEETWEEPAGGGSVAAAELSRLAGSCLFFTALGDDAAADTRAILESYGIAVRAATRAEPQRRATTIVGPGGDRSIIVHGPPSGPLAADALGFDDLSACDAVYVCKADPPLLRLARGARVLVATARILPALREARVTLDALVRSAHDEGERYAPGELEPPPRAVVSTEGGAGGSYESLEGECGRWEPAALPGPLRDTYGAGDSFAAALCYALAAGSTLAEGVRVAAERGACALARPGALGGRGLRR
jgi:ribokinase